MLWVQDPSQNNVDNLNSVQNEASRHFRMKKKTNLKAKIDELETYSKIKNIGDLHMASVALKGVTNLAVV